MATVTLPAGCTGLDLADGTKYTASRPGSAIEVDSRHASAIKRGWYGDNAVITSTGFSFGTKGTRRCATCRRDWNAWSSLCPKCGEATVAA